MDELKKMQNQMELLKQSLSDSRIANQHLLKKVVSQKISSLNRIVWAEVIINPILILLIASFCAAKGISLWFPGIFMIASIIDIIIDFKTMRIPLKEIAGHSLISIRKKLLKQKRQRKIQNMVMAPLALIWIFCLFFEILKPFDLTGVNLTIAWIMCGIVLLVTAVVIVWLNRKLDETTEEIASEIEEEEK